MPETLPTINDEGVATLRVMKTFDNLGKVNSNCATIEGIVHPVFQKGGSVHQLTPTDGRDALHSISPRAYTDSLLPRR